MSATGKQHDGYMSASSQQHDKNKSQREKGQHQMSITGQQHDIFIYMTEI